MAITLLNTASTINDEGTSPITASLTLTAGTNRKLIVLCGSEGTAGQEDFSVSYGGLELFREDFASAYLNPSGTLNQVRVYTATEQLFANLTDGNSYNISVTRDSSSTGGMAVTAYLLAGADQYTMTQQVASNAANVTSRTASVTPSYANSALIAAACEGNGGVTHTWSGQTWTNQLNAISDGSVGTGFGLSSALVLDAGAVASETATVTTSASVNRLVLLHIAVAPVQSATPDSPDGSTFTGTNGDQLPIRAWRTSKYAYGATGSAADVSLDVNSNTASLYVNTDNAGAQLRSWEYLSGEKDVTGSFQYPVAPASCSVYVKFRGDVWGGVADDDRLELEAVSDGTVRLDQRLSGTNSTRASTTGFTWSTTKWWFRFRDDGAGNFMAKVWADGDSEPGAWTLSTTYTAVVAPGPLDIELEVWGSAPRRVNVDDITTTAAITPTGASVTATPGTVTVAQGAVGQNVTPTAPTITVTPGTVTMTTGPVAVAPTGPTVTATPGTVTVTTGPVDVTPTGPVVTATPGTVTVTTTAAITTTGPTVSVAAGTVTVEQAAPGQAVTPAGASVAATPGTVSITTGAVDVAPSGPTVSVTAGTVSVGTVIPPTTTVPVYLSSVGTEDNVTPAEVNYPAYSEGDLIVQWIALDVDVSITPPAAGPHGGVGGGETIITVQSDYSHSSGNPTFKAWAWIAKSAKSAGFVSATLGSNENWVAACVVFDAGTFNPADPFGNTAGPSQGVGTTATLGSWSTTGVDNLPVVAVVINDDDMVPNTPVGWTNRIRFEKFTDLEIAVYTRTAATTLNETIASTSFGLWGSTNWVIGGFTVMAQLLPGTQAVVSASTSLASPVLTSSVDISDVSVIEATTSFPPSIGIVADNASVNASVINIAATVVAPFVLGNASVFPRVMTVRVETPRSNRARLSSAGVSRPGQTGGYEPRSTPAERRAQFDLRRRVQDLE